MNPGNDRVVFGHMHEDHSAELSLVDRLPLKRALVIASGGDLAFALAGAEVAVMAVDSNPAQIDLVRLKMRCPDDLISLCFRGRVDRLLRLGGPFLAWLLDWPRLQPGRLRVFLTNRLEGLLHGVVSVVHGRQAGRKLDRTVLRLIRRRLEKAMRQPDAARNPLLQVLLGNRFGSDVPEVWSERGILKWKDEVGRIDLKTADIVEILRESEDDSLGLISASNLLDVMDGDAWDNLVEHAARVLMPGGYLVVRSMLREIVVSKSDGGLEAIADVPKDASPICPVIWIGGKFRAILRPQMPDCLPQIIGGDRVDDLRAAERF